MPDVMYYTSRADTDSAYVTIVSSCTVPYTFEGYNKAIINFSGINVADIQKVKITINGNQMYYGSDWNDREYNIDTGSSIEAYIYAKSGTDMTIGSTFLYANITLYK